jgi:hypothetical protein
MSDGVNEGERTLDGAQAPAWESVTPASQPAPGQPQILPPPPAGQGYNAGPQGYPPPPYGYGPPPGYVPPPYGQQGYVPPPPPGPSQGQGSGQGTYRPVYDGMGAQGYGAPPPPPGAAYGYGGQYPPYYRNNYDGAEMLAVAAMLPWYRRRIRRTIIGAIFSVFLLLFVGLTLLKILLHMF